MNVTGRCHCGAIAYEAVVDPARVQICHCTDCQALTGTAYRVSVFAPAASFVVRSGTPKIYVKTAESGNRRAHAFCGDCGSPIYSAAISDPVSYTLRVGGLDQRAPEALVSADAQGQPRKIRGRGTDQRARGAEGGGGARRLQPAAARPGGGSGMDWECHGPRP